MLHMILSNILKITIVSLLFLFCSNLFGQKNGVDVAPVQEQVVLVKKGNDDTNPNIEQMNDDVSDMKTLAHLLGVDSSKLTLSMENYQFWAKKSKEIPYNNTYQTIILDHLSEIKLKHRKN